MKRMVLLVALLLAFALAATHADAATRFGGGGNLGKQRSAPTATKDAASAPAQPVQPAPKAPTATPTPPAPQPTFMSRWGGLLAGLGIGLLLSSLFGAQMGPIVGLLLAGLLAVVVIFGLLRLFGGRREPQAAPRPQFAGIGSAIEPSTPPPLLPTGAEASAPIERSPISIPGFDVAPFVRVAKTSFIRLQAANDSGDLDDIRDYTTPEMYAEIAMQLKERGPVAQRTEVVSLDADVVEAVIEDGYEIASVRFRGLIRENDAANPEPFEEIWHVRRKADDRRAPWLIAGIQHAA